MLAEVHAFHVPGDRPAVLLLLFCQAAAEATGDVRDAGDSGICNFDVVMSFGKLCTSSGAGFLLLRALIARSWGSATFQKYVL